MFSGLNPGRDLRLLVFSFNKNGRSKPTVLEGFSTKVAQLQVGKIFPISRTNIFYCNINTFFNPRQNIQFIVEKSLLNFLKVLVSSQDSMALNKHYSTSLSTSHPCFGCRIRTNLFLQRDLFGFKSNCKMVGWQRVHSHRSLDG